MPAASNVTLRNADVWLFSVSNQKLLGVTGSDPRGSETAGMRSFLTDYRCNWLKIAHRADSEVRLWIAQQRTTSSKGPQSAAPYASDAATLGDEVLGFVERGLQARADFGA